MPTNTPVGTLYRRAIRRVDRRAATRRTRRAAHHWSCVASTIGPCLFCARDDQLLREACRLANNLAQSLPPARRR